MHIHTNTRSRPGLALPFHWGKKQLGRTARTPSPALKLPSSNTTKSGLRLFFLGTVSSPHELPKHSHLVHTEKLWSGISAETFAHQRSISPHCIRGHVLQKKPHFVVRKAGWDRRLWLLGFLACWKHHLSSLFFWHEHYVDRWQRGRWCCKYMQLMEKYAFFSEESPIFHCSIVNNSLETMQ